MMTLPEARLDIVPALEIALQERLESDPYINASGICEGAVHNQSAPPGQSYPYVLYQYIRGGEKDDSPRLEIDVEYLVVGVSDDYLTALRLGSDINNAFTLSRLGICVPYYVHWFSRSGLYNRKRFLNNSQEWQIGAFYNIRAHLTGEIDRRIGEL